jgi:hypothetical protein
MASTHILAVGKIVRDGIEMDISMPPWVDPNEPPTDGELARLIWEAEEADEYEDDIEDREFFMRGAW